MSNLTKYRVTTFAPYQQAIQTVTKRFREGSELKSSYSEPINELEVVLTRLLQDLSRKDVECEESDIQDLEKKYAADQVLDYERYIGELEALDEGENPDSLLDSIQAASICLENFKDQIREDIEKLLSDSDNT